MYVVIFAYVAVEIGMAMDGGIFHKKKACLGSCQFLYLSIHLEA